jgi:hypothetical protein
MLRILRVLRKTITTYPVFAKINTIQISTAAAVPPAAAARSVEQQRRIKRQINTARVISEEAYFFSFLSITINLV